MDTTKMRHELIQLDEVLKHLDEDPRDYKDIVNNLRAAIRMDLDYVTECRLIGRDDAADVFYTIASTRERIRFLEEHVDFDGDLIALRVAMGENPSPASRQAANDTEPAPDSTRETWPAPPPIPDSEPMFIGSTTILPKDYE